ncbi:MAG: hypothetical protein PHN75_18680 [Syntrophales bacterium]|nr:hypothetical protein [Syntrophales bacterium]
MDYAKDYTKMAQQMTGFYKSTIGNSISAMNVIQENTARMVTLSLEQSPWFPEEGKKLVTDWMNAYKKGYDDLKVAADEQYKKLDAFVNLQNKI